MPQPAVLRSQIATALDELVAHEEGMRFQDLAVVLAKRRWPALVASERRSDLGLDAFVTRDTAPDGVGRGLACSITAEYSKIGGDAKTTAEHFGESIQHLVFSTPRTVSNPKKLNWAAKIRQEFGYRLEVISREDLISDLLDPRNAPLCRSLLSLDIPVAEATHELIQRVREAAQLENDTWARRAGGCPLIELQSSVIDKDGNLSEETWALANIATALVSSRRLVLEGPAGRGKTTTLIQLAQGQLRERGIVLLVDLPQWVGSGLDILSFVAGTVAFRRGGLTPEDLTRSESAERFCFLLNGWNEVSERSTSDAVVALRALERQFPAAGVIVATRSQSVVPPLPGATRLRVRRVGRSARSAYVQECLGDLARPLLATIESDSALDDLTRTPFVLAEVVALAAAGIRIPRSRIKVIEATIALHESAPEHVSALRAAPLDGMASRILGALASRMVADGAVNVAEEAARAVAAGCASELVSEGLLAQGSSPRETLDALCAHHVLERFDYPSVGFRFAHQLFEEYYASRWLERRFQSIAGTDAPSNIAEFSRQFVNQPEWATPLAMLAESLGTPSGTSRTLGPSAATLVEATLDVDLVFAARLAFLGGVGGDDPVGRQLHGRLRAWHSSSDRHHQRCALAGMLASGTDDFSDIIEPLLSSANQQERLETLRLCGGMSPFVLGTDWPADVRAWSEGARADLIAEILRERFDPDVSLFGLADPSAHVRVTTAQALDWIGAEQELASALSAFDDQTFALFLATSSFRAIPTSLHGRARHELRQRLTGLSDVVQRIRTLLELHALGDLGAVAELKAALPGIPKERTIDVLRQVLVPALDALRVADPVWTGDWVARQAAEGRLGGDWWMSYVADVPADVRDALYVRLASEDLEHRNVDCYVALVAKGTDSALIRRAFQRMLDSWEAVAASDGRAPKAEIAALHQMEALLREISPAAVVTAHSEQLAAEPDTQFLEAFSHLYGRTTATEAPLAALDDGTRALVRNYLRRSLSLVVVQDDFAGGLKAQLGCCLSQVGEPVDADQLMALVSADLRRVRDGRAARARGERSKAADGAPMCWTDTYVRALVALLKGAADDVLLGLLGEPEYERSLLEEYGRQFAPAERDGPGRRPDYNRVWTARTQHPAPLELDPRRARVAHAIRARICEIEASRGTQSEEKHLNNRLKAFALGLAAVAPRYFADEIIELLSLPAEFDAHVCVGALHRILFAGAPLPAAKCLRLLDDSLARMKKWGLQDQDRWTLTSFLQVCPFVDDPAAGLDKIRQVVRDARLGLYDLRELLVAVGCSRFEGALPFMLEVVPTASEWRAVEHDWIRAFVSLDTAGARAMLLGFVDPVGPAFLHSLDWSTAGVLANRLAELAAADLGIDSRLKDLTLASLDDARRQFLARALALRGTPAAKLAVLNLLDDARPPAIPAGVAECIEWTFVEDRAHPAYSNVTTRHPATDNTIRQTLYRMAFEDDKRKRSAYSLLGQVESWRLEYGRPLGEPRNPDIAVGWPWPPPDPMSQA